MNYVFLHGFLGSSRDYGLVFSELEKAGVKINRWAPEFFKAGPVSAAHGYAEWSRNFLNELDQKFAGEKCVLVGYSLGARLAMHAFFADPSKFSRLVLISGNPGVLLSPAEQRRAWEQKWAQTFRQKPWSEALDEWNGMQVFTHATPRLAPLEGQFDRDLVADSLSRWSVLDHLYTQADLMRLPASTQWWFGEFDEKFLAVKAELERLKVPGHYQVFAGAGHRVTLDQPEAVARALIPGGSYGQ